MNQSSYFCDIIKLSSGIAISQALVVLTAPVIARIYGPDAFGVSALFSSTICIIGIIASLRYELAIMLPEKTEDSSNLLILSVLILSLFTLMISIIIWFGNKFIIDFFSLSVLMPYMWLIPLAVFINGFLLILNHWHYRTKRFGRLSATRAANSLATIGVQLGTGFSGIPSPGGLIGANLIGSAVSVLLLGLGVLREDIYLLKYNISLDGILFGLKRYKKFPLLDTWSALLNTIAWQLPPFMLIKYFSSEVVGYYALSMTVIQFPLSLVGCAVSQVFFQRASEARFNGTGKAIIEETVSRLGILGIYPFILLSLAGKDFFIIIFGHSWAEAGVYIQIIGLWMLLVFIISPVMNLFSVLEKQGRLLIFNFALLISWAIALTVGGLFGNSRIALGLFAFAGIVNYLIIGSWILKKTDVNIYAMFKKLFIYIICSLCLCTTIILAKYILNLDSIIILMIGFITSIFYYIFIIFNDKALRSHAYILLNRVSSLL